jgi:hypothetical protein
MAFPDFTLRPDPAVGSGVAMLWVEAEGVLVNGLNVINIPWVDLGIPPEQLGDDGSWIVVYPENGASVTSFAAASPFIRNSGAAVAFDVVQTGADSSKIIMQLVHSEFR